MRLRTLAGRIENPQAATHTTTMIALTPTLARQLAADGPPWDSTVYYVTSDPVTSEVLDRSHTPAKSRC